MLTWSQVGINVGNKKGKIKTLCPKCSAKRKHPSNPCLFVNVEEGLWQCYNCFWKGSLRGREHKRPSFTYTPPDNQLYQWFQKRGISEETVDKFQITLEKTYFSQLEQEVDAIRFPFFKNGEVVNIKSRALSDKVFRQESDAEKVLYGIDNLKECDWCICVEGEVDLLSLYEAGVYNVVSVPDGAPPAGSQPSSVKFEYLRNCEDVLDKMNKIVLAVDGDGPGYQLATELARRLGVERCWWVRSWPEDTKDPNEVLLKYGKEKLKGLVCDKAVPWPLKTIVTVDDVVEDVFALYEKPDQKGLSTGWNAFDEYFTVKPGELTIVTGIPGSRKSVWLDNLLINLSVKNGWMHALYSPESKPLSRHIGTLCSMLNKKSFWGINKMSPSELLEAMERLNKYVVFLEPETEDVNFKVIMDLVAKAVKRHGIRTFVLDPWNDLDHTRAAYKREDEHIGECLTKLRRFARHYDVHIFVVAHPRKLEKDKDGKYPVPTPYEISGSSHWWNRADNCITLWRDLHNPDDSRNVFYIQKVKRHTVGKSGDLTLWFDKNTGIFYEDIESMQQAQGERTGIVSLAGQPSYQGVSV